MAKTLCFDFGNTRLKAAVFIDDQLIDTYILQEESRNIIEKVVHQYQPDYTILSSVIHHLPATEDILRHYSQFHKLSHQSNLPFTIPVGKPETVGADRLALCAAAAHLFPKKNNLVIGLGTCITYNFLNKKHQFMGGSISPGLEMRFRSMHAQTALLPLIQMEWNFPLIGYDTKTNLLSGAAWGMAKEIEGIIDAYEEKFTDLTVSITGGDTSHFAPLLKKQIFADLNLIFKGLYAISLCNR